MPESDLQLKDALGNFSTLNCVLARSVQDFIQFNIISMLLSPSMGTLQEWYCLIFDQSYLKLACVKF